MKVRRWSILRQPGVAQRRTPAQAAAAAVDESLVAGLNPAQRGLVLCTDVPLVIVAGPGTGKAHADRAHRTISSSRCRRAGGHPGNHLHQQGRDRDGRTADRAARGRTPRPVCGRRSARSYAQLLAPGPRRTGAGPRFPSSARTPTAALLREAAPELTPVEPEQLLVRIFRREEPAATPGGGAAAGDADTCILCALRDGIARQRRARFR